MYQPLQPTKTYSNNLKNISQLHMIPKTVKSNRWQQEKNMFTKHAIDASTCRYWQHQQQKSASYNPHTCLYTAGLLVTIVGQNEVTPCCRMPLATLHKSALTLPVSTEKSTPNPPTKQNNTVLELTSNKQLKLGRQTLFRQTLFRQTLFRQSIVRTTQYIFSKLSDKQK